MVRARLQRRALVGVSGGGSLPGDGDAEAAARRLESVLRLMPVVRHHFRCLDCGAETAASLELACGACGGLFEIAYPRLPEGGLRLPLTPLPLGQGGTPTISFDWPDARRLGVELKLEFLSPTGSFKDRGAATLISAAWSGGATAFVEDSSGNAGASLAAYGAAAQMSAEVFVPADAPQVKQAQITAVGGRLHPIDGDREAVAAAAAQYAREQGIPYLSHNRSPYFSEGMKPAAEEIAEHGLPDAIVLPVGNGSLLIGLHRGFQELVRLGRIERMPRLYAIQAMHVSPLVSALRKHEPREPSPTVADGIAVSQPPRLAQMLAAVRESGGAAAVVSEAEITSAWTTIARRGLYVEPTSAVPLAALRRLVERGMLTDDERVLVPLTGSGLKSPPIR
ncbi:MAG: pyridoxal-phosphate dependent enzyme [Chloroflexi bacterium]|nr:pyridoxal-phosphate dependent enzyme [Chloroflexota bacterium]